MGDENGCTAENCDLFDFMAYHVGLSVLHPGGLKATEELINECRINDSSRVIDIACGKGTTSVYLAEKYGCNVVGIDISPDLIADAIKFARHKGVDDRVRFLVADAQNIPFPDNEFDAAVSQAMLILVEDKNLTIKEALRVIRPDGRAGFLELSWKKPPTEQFMNDVTGEMCAYCMENVHTYSAWKKLFKDAGAGKITVYKRSQKMNGMSGMLSDEGFKNTMNIMLTYLTNSKVRARMKKLNDFINANHEYFGYGIYICKKN